MSPPHTRNSTRLSEKNVVIRIDTLYKFCNYCIYIVSNSSLKADSKTILDRRRLVDYRRKHFLLVINIFSAYIYYIYYINILLYFLYDSIVLYIYIYISIYTILRDTRYLIIVTQCRPCYFMRV